MVGKKFQSFQNLSRAINPPPPPFSILMAFTPTPFCTYRIKYFSPSTPHSSQIPIYFYFSRKPCLISKRPHTLVFFENKIQPFIARVFLVAYLAQVLSPAFSEMFHLSLSIKLGIYDINNNSYRKIRTYVRIIT